MTARRGLAAAPPILLMASLASSSASVKAAALHIAMANGDGAGLAGFETDLADALCARIGADCAFILAAGDSIAALVEQKVDAVIASLVVRPWDRAMIADGSLRQLSLVHVGNDITPRQCACKPF